MTPRRVLVVDDDPHLRALLVDTLQTIGYSASGVPGGTQALEQMQNECVDVVISDISMPRMDGFQLAALVREKYPTVRVLLITGVATRESEQKAMREGLCDGYLAKPFRIDRIEAMIEQAMGNKTHKGEGNPGRRVLVVDDDTQFLDALVDTVNSLGYRAEGVSNCDAALSALRREPAEMVIADVSMPRMNGFDLLKVLKRNYPHMPVVMMTGHNLSEPAAATIRDRADAYLTKPFRRDRIKTVLSQLNPSA